MRGQWSHLHDSSPRLIDDLLSLIHSRTNSSFGLGLVGCVAIMWLSHPARIAITIVWLRLHNCIWVSLKTHRNHTATACWFFNSMLMWCLVLYSSSAFNIWEFMQVTTITDPLIILDAIASTCINQPCSRKVILMYYYASLPSSACTHYMQSKLKGRKLCSKCNT